MDGPEGPGVKPKFATTKPKLAKPTVQPGIGTPIVLYVHLNPPSAFEATPPFELTGHIVRHHSTGFAIEYEDNHDPDLRRMVDDAAALVATRR